MKPHFDRYSIHKIRPQRVGRIYRRVDQFNIKNYLTLRHIYNTEDFIGPDNPEDGEQIRVLYTTPKN